jgi:hypothetical protein
VQILVTQFQIVLMKIIIKIIIVKIIIILSNYYYKIIISCPPEAMHFILLAVSAYTRENLAPVTALLTSSDLLRSEVNIYELNITLTLYIVLCFRYLSQISYIYMWQFVRVPRIK